MHNYVQFSDDQNSIVKIGDIELARVNSRGICISNGESEFLIEYRDGDTIKKDYQRLKKALGLNG